MRLLFLLALFALVAVLSGSSGGMPPLDGSMMKMSIIDSDTHAPLIGTLKVRIEASGGAGGAYEVNITAPGQPVSLQMPPASYSPTAHILVSSSGYYDSEEITVTGEEYWGKVGASTVPEFPQGQISERTDNAASDTPADSPQTYLLEKTFALKRNPAEDRPSVQVAENTAPTSSAAAPLNTSRTPPLLEMLVTICVGIALVAAIALKIKKHKKEKDVNAKKEKDTNAR